MRSPNSKTPRPPTLKIDYLAALIAVARGEKPAGLVLKNGLVADVFSGEWLRADVAIFRGAIAGLGSYRGQDEIDLEGKYVLPGLIDGHVHLESAMVHPSAFAEAVVPRGTTTVVADPHEIANVCGAEGIRFMLEATRESPLDVFFMLPSCVPATELETGGARLEAPDLEPFLKHPRVLGMGEMMNYPGVVRGDPGMLEKIQMTGAGRSPRGAGGRLVDGHAPGLTGADLCAYAAAGIGSDHECTGPDEAWEKLRLGLRIMIRESSVGKNLRDLVPAVTPVNSRRFLLVTDDRHPKDLLEEGHLDHLLRRAVAEGLDPVTAVQMATLNPAEYFGLQDRGAVAPGYRADLVVVDDLQGFNARLTITRGHIAAREGKLRPIKKSNSGAFTPSRTQTRFPEGSAASARPSSDLVRDSARIAPLSEADLALHRAGRSSLSAIGLVPGQIVTRAVQVDWPGNGEFIPADPDRDLVKLVVVERHRATGRVGVALLSGFGLRRGAVASSVAHDSHNIIAAGVSDRDILAAVREVARCGGGLAVAEGGEILGRLPLPIAGLMSDRPLEEVAFGLENLHRLAREMGVRDHDPFMTLAFLSLPVIPELKLTDLGLVDVKEGRIIPAF